MAPKWLSSISVLVVLFFLTTALWLVDLDSVQEHPVLIGYNWCMWLTFVVQIPVAATIINSFVAGNVTILEADWSKVRWRRWLGRILTSVAGLTLSLSVAWAFFWLVVYVSTESQIPVETDQKFALLNMACMGVPALILAFIGLRIGKEK
ncbi:MAG: hypothetical protein V1716_01040 [Candidatus Uhrbacteria bacterium]